MAPRTAEHRSRPMITRMSVVGLVVVTIVTAGCSANTDPEQLNTREPETAAVSPELSAVPAGDVAAERFGGATAVESIAIEPSTRIAAVLTDDGTSLLLSALDGNSEPRTVRLSSPGTSVSPGRDGELLVSASDGVEVIDASSGNVTTLSVDGGAVSATVWENGYAAGTPTGTVVILGSDGESTAMIAGQASVDALVPAGRDLISLDTKQTSVTAVNVGAERLGAALRAGEGATRMTGCADGAIPVADTADDELLIFTGDDLIMRQRFPVAGAPYALACDDAGTVWVTTTATNEVLGFDISSGMPVETSRFPTVRQPDSLAVDSQTGTIFVGSKTGGGVQVIRTGQ